MELLLGPENSKIISKDVYCLTCFEIFQSQVEDSQKVMTTQCLSPRVSRKCNTCKNTEESNDRDSFVACDVSTDRNECCLGVESTSPYLCQMVRYRAQGSFGMSLCFGWLSSFCSPVILWSCQVLALFLTLCLTSWVWWERRCIQDRTRRETKVSNSHHSFLPTRPFLSSPWSSHLSRSPFRWQKVRKYLWLPPDTRWDFSVVFF